MKKCFVLFLVIFVGIGSSYALAHGKQAAAQKAAKAATPAAPAAVDPPAKESDGEQKEASPGRVIGEQADRLLRQMCDTLKAAGQFSFHADILYDDLLASGQKVQLAAADKVLIRRPDRIYAEFQGETGDKRFWYDGKTMTLYDPKHHVYGTEEVPATIDAMLDHLIKAIGFAPPLSDLAYGDPYAVLTQNVQYGFYAGLTQVGGEPCHHLAFQEKKIDWQIWIEDGTRWVPRKLVITYKTLPGAPQFMATFSHWDFATPAPDGVFSANLPPDAARIAFLTMAQKQSKEGGAQ